MVTGSKQVLITGIRGKLGRHLKESFQKQGFHVIGTTRNLDSEDDDITIDLSVQNAADLLLKKVNLLGLTPEIIILNAADTRSVSPPPDETETYIRMNHINPLKIAKTFLQESDSVKIIFISSVLAHLNDHLNPLYHDCKKKTEEGLKLLENSYPGRISCLISGPLKEQPRIPLYGSYKFAAEKVVILSKKDTPSVCYPLIWNWIITADQYLLNLFSGIIRIFRKA